MKRSTLFLLAAVLAIAAVAVVAYAQIGGGGGPMEPSMGLVMPGVPPPEGMEMPPMARGGMGPVAIAVSGTHVYVISGGLLLQYDQALDLVNQVEIPGIGRGFPPGGGRGMGRRGMGGGGRGMHRRSAP